MSSILEQGSGLNTQRGPIALQADAESAVFRTRVLNPDETGDIVVTFAQADEAMVAAIEQFCLEHRAGTFPYQIPNGGAVIDLTLLAPPEIRRRAGSPATVTVRLRQVLAID